MRHYTPVKSINVLLNFNFKNIFHLIPLVCFLILNPTQSTAGGKGPIGIYAITEQHVLIADSSLPGIVLVDLDTGIAIERLVIEGNPTCISSCPNCNFALITGKSGSAWKLIFKDNVHKLLKNTGSLDLEDAQLKPLDFSYPGGSKKGKIDGRICLVDDSGKNAYIAALNDHGVFHLDLSNESNISRLMKGKKRRPYGLNWDKHENILVTMHRQEIWRINSKGKRLATYNINKALCPGTRKHNPILRAAIDNPLNSNSLIILANSSVSRSSVIWRLNYYSTNQPTDCSILAGGLDKGPGWLDSNNGKSTTFSRPHYFTLLPDGTHSKIIITDIDNRSLRILDLLKNTSSSIMYDRDRRLFTIPAKNKKSTVSCQKLGQEVTHTVDAQGNKSCVSALISSSTPEFTYHEAKSHCKAQGTRLCEPAELRHTDILANKKTWTTAECASCWQGNTGEHCKPIIQTSKKNRSWNSGQAIEIGSTATEKKATFCSSTNNKNKASAFCCADAF